MGDGPIPSAQESFSLPQIAGFFRYLVENAGMIP
jgi:hypothetical protein